MAAIEFENVKFSYAEGGFALRGINLSVEEGEFLAVLGHNGSGKSTLARLTNGLLEAQEGKITVFGKEVTAAGNTVQDLFEIRKQVGIVFQNPDNQMVASIIEDDVAFGPENIGLDREEIGRRIDWALAAVDMLPYKTGTPTRLSGGQKQRIAIAGVLAMRPKVLILDESTAMLDPQGRREVMDVVRRLNQEEKMTVVLITHFMEEALLADRVIVMNRGEIVKQGKPRQIFEAYEDLETFGLSLPYIGRICRMLQKSGMPVRYVLRPEELAEEIERCVSKRNI